MKSKLSFIFIALFVFVIGAIGTASAEVDSKTHIGLRLGLSQEPDQVVIGIQSQFGKVAKVGKFSPSVDLGVGNDFTVIAGNLDFYFPLFSPPKSSLDFFVAVGPTLAYLNHDKAGSDTEIGVSGTIGLTSPMGGSHLYNLELRFGFGDIPDLKILFGFML